MNELALIVLSLIYGIGIITLFFDSDSTRKKIWWIHSDSDSLRCDIRKLEKMLKPIHEKFLREEVNREMEINHRVKIEVDKIIKEQGKQSDIIRAAMDEIINGMVIDEVVDPDSTSTVSFTVKNKIVKDNKEVKSE